MDSGNGQGGQPEELDMSEEDLDMVLSNTAAVLGPIPGKMDEWREVMVFNAERAIEQGHEEVAVFLQGIVRLLDEGPDSLDAIWETIPEAYQHAWETLSATLRGEPVRGLSKNDIILVLNNTTVVLTLDPGKRDEWNDQLRASAQEADAAGDSDTRGFLLAVARLVEEGIEAAGEITASVPDAYYNPWEALLRFLRKRIDHLRDEGLL